MIRPNPFLPSGSSFSICIPLFILSHATVRLRPYSLCLARTGNASSGNVSSQCVVRGDGDYPESVVAMRLQRHCQKSYPSCGCPAKMNAALTLTDYFFSFALRLFQGRCLTWCPSLPPLVLRTLGLKSLLSPAKRKQQTEHVSISASDRMAWLEKFWISSFIYHLEPFSIVPCQI